jgi:predicted acyltransferase
MPSDSATGETPPESTSQRLISLDALRGFDMCWILGLAGVVKAIWKRFQLPGGNVIEAQLEHVRWDGFHFYDLIFPLFLFIAGVSLAIALPRHVARYGLAVTVRKLILRAAILFLLGVFYSGGLQKGLDQVRWLGVLQRIALGSCFAGLLSLWLSPRGLLASAVILLVGYWALLTFVPVPEFGAGNYAEGKNLTNYLDRIWLPGHKYDGDHDPEGILSTLPAIATALLGILAGKWILGPASPLRKGVLLMAVGAALVGLGLLWGLQFPVIKKIWSSSFVLMAGGWSSLLLGAFYLVIEVAGIRWWTAPFVWVGANPILLYVCAGLGLFRLIGERLVGPMGHDWNWVPAAVNFALMLLVARFLYRRNIFLRV